MASEIGIALSADYFPQDSIISLSPQIDSLGYSQISVPELWGHDAFSLLAVLAHQTKSVKLATGVVNIFSRSVATMAMTATTIDELSHNRFILGLGVSGPKVIEDWHGMTFEKPLTRTKEYVELLRAIFHRDRLNHTTTQIGSFKDFKITTRNIRADLPIHIASLGPKNIELTAKIADGWIPVFMPIDNLKEQINTINDFLAKFQRDKNRFDITPFIPSLIGTTPEELDLVRGHLAYYFGQMGDFYNNMLERSGFEEEAHGIKDNWRKGNIKGARDAISDHLLDQIAIWGTKDHAQEQLVKFTKAGATRPILMLPFKSPMEKGIKTFTELAPVNEVM